MENGDVQIDSQLIVESMSRQIAEKARECAMKDAVIFMQHQEIQELKKQIDEMGSSLTLVKDIGKKEEGKNAETEDNQEERKVAKKG